MNSCSLYIYMEIVVCAHRMCDVATVPMPAASRKSACDPCGIQHKALLYQKRVCPCQPPPRVAPPPRLRPIQQLPRKHSFLSLRRCVWEGEAPWHPPCVHGRYMCGGGLAIPVATAVTRSDGLMRRSGSSTQRRPGGQAEMGLPLCMSMRVLLPCMWWQWLWRGR